MWLQYPAVVLIVSKSRLASFTKRRYVFRCSFYFFFLLGSRQCAHLSSSFLLGTEVRGIVRRWVTGRKCRYVFGRRAIDHFASTVPVPFLSHLFFRVRSRCFFRQVWSDVSGRRVDSPRRHRRGSLARLRSRGRIPRFSRCRHLLHP